jgi:hypothetical protein
MSRWVVIWLGLSVGLASCSDAGSPLESAGGTANAMAGSAPAQVPNAGTGASPATSCRFGEECDCPGGLRSTTTCDAGTEVCECEACPAQAPSEPAPAYQACGGAPFGAWRLVNIDYSEVALNLRRQGLGAAPFECPTTVEEPSLPRMLLTLLDGGDGEIFQQQIAVAGWVPESCVTQMYANASCEDLQDCESAGCGTCRCFNPLSFDNVVDWQTMGNQLHLTSGGSTVSFDYCVEAESTLTMKRTTGVGVIYRLESVTLSGTPAPCSERPADACLGGGCTLGACLGPSEACASANSEGDCTNNQGCTWDPGVCGGQTLDYCELGYYGVVPGCSAQ